MNSLEELLYQKLFPVEGTFNSGLYKSTALLMLVLMAMLTAAAGFLPQQVVPV